MVLLYARASVAFGAPGGEQITFLSTAGLGRNKRLGTRPHPVILKISGRKPQHGRPAHCGATNQVSHMGLAEVLYLSHVMQKQPPTRFGFYRQIEYFIGLIGASSRYVTKELQCGRRVVGMEERNDKDRANYAHCNTS